MSNFNFVRCAQCNQEFGIIVGKIVTLTVGKATYVLEHVKGIKCDRCNKMRGREKKFSGTAQDNRCPNSDCKERQPKCGEMYADGFIVEYDGREVWATKVHTVECKCGAAWVPSYTPEEDDDLVIISSGKRLFPTGAKVVGQGRMLAAA